MERDIWLEAIAASLGRRFEWLPELSLAQKENYEADRDLIKHFNKK